MDGIMKFERENFTKSFIFRLSKPTNFLKTPSIKMYKAIDRKDWMRFELNQEL
jgi:hypothetical protein